MTATGLDDHDKADWYLKRAAKMRVMAEAAIDTGNRGILFQMAEDYEHLAEKYVPGIEGAITDG